MTAERVQDVLRKSEGNVMYLTSQLVDSGAISIDTLDEFAGLCRSLMIVLGKNDKPAVTTGSVSKTEPDVKVAAQAISTSKDSMAGVTAWPAQEKREKGTLDNSACVDVCLTNLDLVAGMRTCILKGVNSIKNIHDLQALVWGGPLEYIELDRDGSGCGVVRFLTPEACEAYFDATANGIKLPGDSGSLVFVEQKPGVNSTNDTLNNAATNNITRCVRALDADKDWNAYALMGLARGPDKRKREVDVILSGVDSNKRFYFDFRFANIYDAINFRRSLTVDEDWEMCKLIHVSDPCATAQGPHFNDVESDGKLIAKGFT
ncbi:hypothetical protein DM02DRAFT_168034 [Periconia macrospinosa]|uniref:RRM domain-containing protein n=1 Tax=Periconia macrospinosa TaxID=97972 RepID=A0A2V1E317_9PLEO|nr:hypothetical protein DM02DRAFT_168034 [Periconia macrospinosa]